MQGFTLVETLVAIAILTMTIVGPYQITGSVLSSAYIARDQLVATGLAQEGIEYIRAIRDSNYLYNVHNTASLAWLSGLDGTNGPNCFTNGCVVDPTQYPASVPFVAGTSVIDCGSGDATCSTKPLYISSANLYNQQSSGTATPFVRKVLLRTVNSNETEITVTVTWSNHGVHTVTLKENLQNWL